MAGELESIERRRFELLAITCFVIVALAIALVAVAFGDNLPPFVHQYRGTAIAIRISLPIVILAFAAYVVDKERRLRRALALAMRERELAASLSERLNELLLVGQASREFGEAQDLAETLEAILRSGRELLGADEASIMLADGAQLVLAAAIGRAENYIGEHTSLTEGVAGDVASKRTPLLVTGAAHHDAELRARSAMSAPLVASDELIGVLNLSIVTGSREFTDYDLRAVALFAEHAGRAISRARERRRNRVLADAAAGVAGELREPLERIRRAVAQLMRDDSGPDPAARRGALHDIEADVQRALDSAAWLTKPRG